MISVTKLNGQTHVINALFIEQLEATPDTLVTLTTGKKFVVKESVEDVIAQAKRFYQELSLLPNADRISRLDESET